MSKWTISWQDFLIVGVITAHCLLSPFTKVEESFNLQAVHDILHHDTSVSEYDHLQFPGVVSRTFIGALVLSAVSYPTVSLYRVVAPCHSSLHDQVIVRLSLGLLTAFSLSIFRCSVQKHFGWLCSVMFTLLTMSQFHLMYYASRTLPNVFAFNIVVVSFSYWMELHSVVQNSVKTRNQIIDQLIWAAAIAGIILRSELIILYLPLFAMEVFVWRTVGISRLIWSSLKAAVACLVFTVTIDSYFWQRWFYPEGEVLWFNTVQNQSHHWGVSPVHAYVTIFLPKLTLSGYLMFLVNSFHEFAKFRMQSKFAPYLFVIMAFITIYSLLPHKEWRFIIYVLPLMNLISADQMSKSWINRHKSQARVITAVFVVLMLAANFSATSLMTYISMQNYPGGHALMWLHNNVSVNKTVSVHIDPESAMSGISLFGHQFDKHSSTSSRSLSGRSRG
ncbi:hypothetical protein MIR68_001059 [Amoeboaphelidium protococcarum]|nr:hypothetical protein MIR68_001059 [Amoeboaphelidium protococcarum]